MRAVMTEVNMGVNENLRNILSVVTRENCRLRILGTTKLSKDAMKADASIEARYDLALVTIDEVTHNFGTEGLVSYILQTHNIGHQPAYYIDLPRSYGKRDLDLLRAVESYLGIRMYLVMQPTNTLWESKIMPKPECDI